MSIRTNIEKIVAINDEPEEQVDRKDAMVTISKRNIEK